MEVRGMACGSVGAYGRRAWIPSSCCCKMRKGWVGVARICEGRLTSTSVAKIGGNVARRYSSPAGVPTLREAIAKYETQRRGVEVAPSEVVVGPGAKPGLFFPALALINPGDEVVYPDPGFPTYKAMILVAGGVPVRPFTMSSYTCLLSPPMHNTFLEHRVGTMQQALTR